ncbi:MAG: hypothetical protein F6K39_42235 [Okeania sp. SIO3B3]|nr:hypothetical protein [Okeania sp. SIO3B3]
MAKKSRDNSSDTSSKFPVPHSELRREERRRNRSIRRKFFGQVSGTEFYRAIIRTDIIPQITDAKKFTKLC